MSSKKDEEAIQKLNGCLACGIDHMAANTDDPPPLGYIFLMGATIGATSPTMALCARHQGTFDVMIGDLSARLKTQGPCSCSKCAAERASAVKSVH